MSFRNFVTDMDPNDFCEFVDDFHGYTATDWVITTTEAGTGSATEVVQDESFGVLKLTNAAGDKLASSEKGGYILPNIKRSFDLKSTAGKIPVGKAKLLMTHDDSTIQTFDVTVAE